MARQGLDPGWGGGAGGAAGRGGGGQTRCRGRRQRRMRKQPQAGQNGVTVRRCLHPRSCAHGRCRGRPPCVRGRPGCCGATGSGRRGTLPPAPVSWVTNRDGLAPAAQRWRHLLSLWRQATVGGGRAGASPVPHDEAPTPRRMPEPTHQHRRPATPSHKVHPPRRTRQFRRTGTVLVVRLSGPHAGWCRYAGRPSPAHPLQQG